jgi:uncharacterized protein YkwD/LysM repeat protein
MMNPKHRKALITIPLFITLVALCFGTPQEILAQAGSPAEMHQGINSLRAANGLPALAVSNYLMQSAQNHANWIAAGNPGGHTGAGGSSAKDRALAVGYGEGREVFVTENWARGVDLSVTNCIYNMWNDAAHMGNMLTTRHNEFGAGVALDGQGMTIYVVNFGHVSGSAPLPVNTATPGGPTVTPPGPTNTSIPLIQPILSSTPNPDGSVVHVVQYGQALYPIADAYGISLADLLALNNLTEDSIIYVGQELLIIPASQEVQEETPEEIDEAATANTPSATPSPTTTPTPEPIFTDQAPSATPMPEPQNSFLGNIFSGETLWVGIGLVAVSIIGIGLLLYTSSRLK